MPFSKHRSQLIDPIKGHNMAFKIVIFASIVAIAKAGVVSPIAYPSPIGRVASPYAYAAGPVSYAAHPAPVAYAAQAAPLAYAAHAAPVAVAKTVAAVDTDYDPNPSYSYAYDVQDALTGDSKTQHESRQGDVVQGSYSLTDPDGTRRTVEYTADPHNGFNAVVHREPLVAKAVVAAPAVAKVHAPVAYAAAPAFAKVAAPIAYSPYAAQPAYAYHH